MQFFYPAIILFSIVGSFAITNTMSSIVVMMVMGVIGYFLQQRNFPISTDYIRDDFRTDAREEFFLR